METAVVEAAQMTGGTEASLDLGGAPSTGP